MIHYVKGDLFVNTYKAEAFAHGCNCKGVMSAGIAKQFRIKLPEMYKAYKKICEEGDFKPGDVYVWDRHLITILNMATQYNPGPNAEYGIIYNALVNMRKIMEELNICSVSMPAIGCGIGGLKWGLIAGHIEHVLGNWDGDVYVYDKYEKEEGEHVI